MALRFRSLAILLGSGLAIASCARSVDILSSHDGGAVSDSPPSSDATAACSGARPTCVELLGDGCCGSTESAAVCGADGAFRCPSGTLDIDACSDCAPIGDAGASDAPMTCGPPPPPDAPCFEMDPAGCCRGSGAPVVCSSRGVWECEPGLVIRASCPSFCELVNCDVRDAFCAMPPPFCELGDAPEVAPGCWTGRCVPIVSCGCTTTDECPAGTVCYTAGHCGYPV